MTVYQTDPSGPDSEITQDESIVADAVQAAGSDGFDLASATASPVGEAGGAQSQQVWSLAQLYSIDFSKSRIDVKKSVFNKRTIKVCVSCC